MNIEVGQIYSRKIVNFNCSALVIDVINSSWYQSSAKIRLEILTGGAPGYKFSISEKQFLIQFEFNEKLTNEHLIKDIIE